ncbi:hypothetical protein EVAR_83346_1 [Eumeta japonica]|uniref:Uncharacterized protein n=1 Tax=Eumeta variegata TaxID=151549 RepID=A0A4C1VYB6_EUMVA|nr:hypothetical protein EVAR_83346_1 [Eumeta japonica]
MLCSTPLIDVLFAVVCQHTVQHMKLCRSELPVNDVLRRFSAPQTFLLLRRIAILRYCGAFVINFTTVDFSALYCTNSYTSKVSANETTTAETHTRPSGTWHRVPVTPAISDVEQQTPGPAFISAAVTCYRAAALSAFRVLLADVEIFHLFFSHFICI